MVANAHVGLWDLTSPLLICVRYLNPPQARTHGRENMHGHTTPESVQLSPRPRGAVNRMCDRTHLEKQRGARRGGTGKQKGRGKRIGQPERQAGRRQGQRCHDTDHVWNPDEEAEQAEDEAGVAERHEVAVVFRIDLLERPARFQTDREKRL